MTRPMLSSPVVISQFWRNRAHEAITVQLSTYQAKNMIDIRVWRIAGNDDGADR